MAILDSNDRASPPVRRTSQGVIDIAYYEMRARKLRSRWLHACLRKFAASSIAAFFRRRRAASELHALDETTLRDIGITRADIPAIVDGAYFRDESRRQRVSGSSTCSLGGSPDDSVSRRSIWPSSTGALFRILRQRP